MRGEIVYIVLAALRSMYVSILPRLILGPYSIFQLSLALHFPGNINGMLHCLLCLFPQLVRQPLRFFAPFLHLRIRPLEVECQVEVCFVLALGDGIIDETARVEIAEVDLRHRNAVSLRDSTRTAQSRRLGVRDLLSTERGYPNPRRFFRLVVPCLL